MIFQNLTEKQIFRINLIYRSMREQFSREYKGEKVFSDNIRVSKSHRRSCMRGRDESAKDKSNEKKKLKG